MSDRNSREIITRRVEETESEAAAFAGRVDQSQPVIVKLEGDLGAGKTQFVRGIVRALGGDPREVHSPTYVLLHSYACGDATVHHLDAYRIHSADDFESIGLPEIIEESRPGDFIVVEWASKVADLFQANAIEICIEHRGGNERVIRFRHSSRE